jgi:hypothetical protein
MAYTTQLTGTPIDHLLRSVLKDRARRAMGRKTLGPIRGGVENAPPDVQPSCTREGDTHNPDGRCAVEELRGWVPLGEHMAAAVYSRLWRGEHFVRWRVWHRHRSFGEWYGDKRRFGVFKAEAIGELAQALLAAAASPPADDKTL